MLGKEVVTNWVIDSVKQGELQSTEQYLARDHAREEVWGVSLKEAVERETQGIKALQDWSIHLTASAKKEVGKSGFSGIDEIANLAGARSMSAALPRIGPE